MLVSKPTYGGGAPLGIDLEAGVAKITLPARPVETAPEADDDTDAATPTDGSESPDDLAEDA